MDDEGNLLALGERGEIVVRSSLVMAGYYRDPVASAEAARHGWHHTGDIGYLDADNYLFIVDRAKDMIITGGFNVYSVEVEQALMQHSAVQDCAVVGLPDDKWGERVTAVVQPYPGGSVAAADLRSFVKDRIGSVKARSRSRYGRTCPGRGSARSSRVRSSPACSTRRSRPTMIIHDLSRGAAGQLGTAAIRIIRLCYDSTA
jgi:fatty-acyl-CoA synthase